MTPMSRLKNNLDLFTSLIGDKFEQLQLNKAQPQQFATGGGYAEPEDLIVYEKKGVKADFVKIFRVQFNKENTYSFGFSFMYENLSLEEQNVTFSIKVGSENPNKFMVHSEKFNIETFKNKLNELNKELSQYEDIAYHQVIDIVANKFIDNLGHNINYAQKLNPAKKVNNKLK